MSPRTGSISYYEVFYDFVATLDQLNVPLLECSVLAIVTSLAPSDLMKKTNLLTDHLHWLGGQDLVNVFKFFSVIAFIRPDATNYLTDEMIQKTCKQMVYAEHRSHGEITRQAMMLLVNISNHRFECVMRYLKNHLECPRYCTLKTLRVISSKHADEFVKHLPEILSKVKAMTMVNSDSGIKMVIYDLVQNFSNILLNYLKEREQERNQFTFCIKLIIDILCVTCRDLYPDPRRVPDYETSMTVQKPRSVEDLVRHRSCPTERSNNFEIHYSVHFHLDLSYTIGEGQTAMSYYVQEVLTDKKRRQDIMSYLLLLLESCFPAANITSTLFFSELLCHPGLIEKKVMKHLLRTMMEKTRYSDSVECLLAIRALGNATEGYPGLALSSLLKNKNFDILYEILQGQRHPKVIIEILQLFSKMSKLMKPKNHHAKLHKILEYCKEYMNDVDLTIQTHSLELFADLAQRFIEQKSETFKQDVENCLSTLFIKLHSEDVRVVAAGTAALFHSLPYISCKVERKLLGGDSSGNTSLWSIFQQIGRKQPDLIRAMMLQCVKLLRDEEDCRAVLKHLEMLTDSIPIDALTIWFLKDMCQHLNTMLYNQNPEVKWAINDALNIVSNKWKRVKSLRVHSKPEINWKEVYRRSQRF